jgi:acyl carrier protein
VSSPDVESVLIGYLAESRGSTRDEVLQDLERTGGIDSLEGLELAVQAEKTFEIVISDKELSSDICRSVSSLVGLIQTKLASASPPGGDVRT